MTWRKALLFGLTLLPASASLSIRWSAAAPQATAAEKAEPAEAEAEAEAEPGAGEPGEGDPKATTGARPVAAAPSDPAERKRWLTRELDAVIAAHPRLINAKISAAAAEISSGATLWQHGGAERMSLASTTKLFTSVAALRALGAGYVWRTALYGSERAGAEPAELTDDTLEALYLRGRGDPTLEYPALQALARDLAALGVRRIRKELVLDATFFDRDVEPPHFAEQPKELAAFRAPVSALSLSRNAITLILTPDPKGGAPQVRLDPPIPEYVKVNTDELVATERGRTRVRVELAPEAAKQRRKRGATLELRVRGQLATGGGPVYRRLRVDDPAAFLGAALRAALAEQRIRAPDRVTVAAVPATARVLVGFDSPTLGEVVRRMNKTSDNFLAEVVFKTLGAERRAQPGPGTWADGAAALGELLASLPKPLRVDNGSGLFDASEASAAQLVALLLLAHRDFRVAPDLLASLPIGGVDGTLRSRFTGRPAEGLVRAKTGTLAKVSALAGYVGADSSRLLAFAILLNELTPAQRGEARLLQEDLVDVLARYHVVPATPPAPAAPGAKSGTAR